MIIIDNDNDNGHDNEIAGPDHDKGKDNGIDPDHDSYQDYRDYMTIMVII